MRTDTNAVGHAEHAIDGPNLVGCRDRQANTVPVGSCQPNAFGLYDVLGNVAGWVDDCWNESYEGASADGIAWYEGDCSLRVWRGGSYGFPSRLLRSAHRFRFEAANRVNDLGFRVARTVN